MTSTPIYAQLAARVYAAKDENRTYVPTGWTELEWLPDRWNGFSAGVYKNGNDIVIAFTGTNGQKAADFGWANLLAATGAPSPQVTEAMLLYFQVKQVNPTANITFTGHSLGGGIASMMSIFFDRPAQVFDAAPFELGARNLASLAIYKATTSAAGYSDPAFDTYRATAALSDTVFNAREAQVRNTFLKGEFLELARTSVTEIGSSTPVDVGSPTGVSAFSELHSMTLLAAMLTSSAFAGVVRTNPSLIATLFSKALYATDAETSTERDFLTSLYSAQVKPTGAVPLLDRFAADLQRLSGDGLAAQPSVQKALTVAALEYYYFKDATSATALFSAAENGIHFKPADLGIEAAKSKALPLLIQSILPFINNPDITKTQLLAQDAWHIQSGTGGMVWSGGGEFVRDIAVGGAQTDVLDGGAGADILVGGAGADFLTGGSGTDILDGGEGNDVLNGGTGNDILMGGAGVDIYQFLNGDGQDTITDSDGLGKIVLNGNTITSAKGAGQRDVWRADLGSGASADLRLLDDASSSTGTISVDFASKNPDIHFDRLREWSGEVLICQIKDQKNAANQCLMRCVA